MKFNLTESEKEAILNQHKAKGYRQPLNETSMGSEYPYDINKETYLMRHDGGPLMRKGTIMWNADERRNYPADTEFGDDWDEDIYTDFDKLVAKHPDFHKKHYHPHDIEKARETFDRKVERSGPLYIKTKKVGTDY